MKRDWKVWLKAAGIRAVKTIAQAAIGAVGSAAFISEIDILEVISAAVLAGIVSLLTSLAGIPEEACNVAVIPEASSDTREDIGLEQ